MFDTILFDCDGVIVDSEKGLSMIAADVLRSTFGIPAIASDFREFIGMGEDGYIGGVVRKHGGVYTIDMKEEIYRQYIERAPSTVESFPGTKDILSRFKSEGFRIAVASSSDFVKVSINLKVAGLEPEFFDAVITGSDVEKKKPDPEIYIKAMNACRSSAERCVVVEDAISGITAGVRAGMKVVAYTSSLSETDLLNAGAFAAVAGPVGLYEVIHEYNENIFAG